MKPLYKPLNWRQVPKGVRERYATDDWPEFILKKSDPTLRYVVQDRETGVALEFAAPKGYERATKAPWYVADAHQAGTAQWPI